MISRRPQSWKWAVCAMLLMATMLNYMDRQTLSLTISQIQEESQLTNEQYGTMEFGFGMAFAAGGLLTGFLVDRMSARWLYPLVLIGWSLAGIATAELPLPIGRALLAANEAVLGFVHSYLSPSLAAWLRQDVISTVLERGPSQSDVDYATYAGLFACRTLLGFFEAGHWPCALVVTQRILAQHERSFGNSILQSGAAIGAILTPIIVGFTVSDITGGWRLPFVIIGALGMTWVIPWLLLVRASDVSLRKNVDSSAPDKVDNADEVLPERRGLDFWRRFAALMVVVVMINLTWQFFRAWLPKFLVDAHGFDATGTSMMFMISAYYIAADIGCIASGFMGRRLANRGWSVHSARMATFSVCTAITMLSLIVPVLPWSPVLLVILLLIGAAALGLFPNYYSFTQELSARNQGKVTGILGALTWVVTSIMQKIVGRRIDEDQSYAFGLQLAGLVPLLAWLALVLLWPRSGAKRDSKAAGAAR